MLLFMDKKRYMVTDCAVSLCKKLGKSGVSGFVNAFLRRFDKAAVDEEQLTADVLSAAQVALDSFVAMRESEGAQMKADILGRAQTILSIVSEIEARSPQDADAFCASRATRCWKPLGLPPSW